MSLRNNLRRAALAVLVGVFLLVTLDWAFPPNLRRYEQQGHLLLAEDGTLISALPAPDYYLRFGASVAEVDPFYLRLLKSVEDQWYDHHPGVNPFAIGRALFQAASEGRIVSGASTLTMQTARLLEPRPRTFTSKLIEMLRALQLEAHYSKDEILNIYLTLAPYGSNIEGVRAASLSWFGKPLQRLNVAEAALLVALPQSPEKFRPDRHPEAARRARHKILRQAVTAGVISPQQAEEADQAPLPRTRYALPRQAPHLALRLASPSNTLIHSTIDAKLQIAFANVLAQATHQHEKEVTLAGLIVENATGKVKAYVGNATYADATRRGMVDIVQAVRSPGSTLKPFIYGMAFDRLPVHPQTIIADIPLRFGTYAPANFDRGYQGEITISSALQHSLNLPAVALLDRVGPVNFDSQLKASGITLRFDRRIGKATLPIALGGVGLTLEDLVRLYGSLTQQGRVGHLTYEMSHAAELALSPFMSPAAAWYVAHILQDTPRPEGFSQPTSATERFAFGFKTGTSYGFRDAWAVGFTSDYTLGIWMGRADGAPCYNCVGIKAAAPVLIKALDLLPPPRASMREEQPANILLATAANQLPPALQRFSLKDQSYLPRAATLLTPPLRLAFPVEGTIIELAPEQDHLPLRAEGGERPLSWIINGQPLPVTDTFSREAVWNNVQPGYNRFTVRDAIGATATAEVFVKAPPASP